MNNNTDQDKSRAEFEAWARANGHCCGIYDDGEYVTPTNYLWEGWKARRSAAPVQPDDDALIEDAVRRNNVYGVLPNSASTMAIGRAVLAAHREALSAVEARKGQQEPVAYLIRERIGGYGWSEWKPCMREEGEARKGHADIFELTPLFAAPIAQQAGRAEDQQDAQVDDIQWGHDLQNRLLAASKDVTEGEDARQMMAEAACLLALLVGRAAQPKDTTDTMKGQA